MERWRNTAGKSIRSVKRYCELAVILCILIAAVIFLLVRWDKVPESAYQTTKENTTTEWEAWSRDSLREGIATVIEYDKQYSAYVFSEEEARQAIKEYGIRQREKYSNPPVEKIELQMEKDFDILAVNLGEIDEETAKDIRKAFSYMYEAYPQLNGTITNLSLGNFENAKAGNIAVTQNTEFIINEEFGRYPFVVKCEIILNAAKFKNRKKLLRDCEYQAETGYWPEGSDITSIVVHELGHQLLNVIAMEQFGLEDACYITEENEEAYSRYVTDQLSINQNVAKSVLRKAYDIWKREYHHTGTEEEFRSSISDYAKGEQMDGGISYGETFAEAIADVYLNKEAAADASKAVVDAVCGNVFNEGLGDNEGYLEKGEKRYHSSE